MAEDEKTLEYQQDCFVRYLDSIGIQEPYNFPDSNPIRPLPPILTATHSLMIVGAYPSARFEYRPSRSAPKKYRLVPVANNLQPFGREQYFDGLRVRNLESAEGLQEYLLYPLQTSAEQCWITDLVKVFLYKPAHIDSCRDTMEDFVMQANRASFPIYAERSLQWLEREIRLCKPKLIITLGLEVAQMVSGRKTAPADELLNQAVEHPRALLNTPTLFLPHPDACRRYEKWQKIMPRRIELVKSWLADSPTTINS